MENTASLKTKMVATGVITYPDGTTKEITLTAKTPITDENKDNDNSTSKHS